MIIVTDRPNQRVLLEIPNRLGWKLHFGCATTSGDEALHQLSEAIFDPPPQKPSEKKNNPSSGVSLRPAGLMFFSFPTTPPMRVRVYEAPLGEKDAAWAPKAGKFYPIDRVPYDRMWADDVVWMPTLLQEDNSYFEAHFVFDGPPGGSSALSDHSYQKYC